MIEIELLSTEIVDDNPLRRSVLFQRYREIVKEIEGAK